MKWTLILAVGAIAGAALAARRRNLKAAADSNPWSVTTDPVTPTGGI